jgi:predicted outer membrane repeat protein
MDQSQFDRIARLLGGAISRRAGIGAALAALTGSQVATTVDAKGAATGRDKGRGTPGAEGPCGNGKRKANICTKDKDCCTGICGKKPPERNKDGKGRCRCIQRQRRCTEDRNCCGTMTCNSGKCGPGVTKIPTGKACTVTDVCEDAAARCTTYFSGSPDGTYCLLPNGQSCSAAKQCASSDCDGTCKAETCTVCTSGCTYDSVDAALAGTAAGGTISIDAGTWTTSSQGLIDHTLTVRACNRAAVTIEGTSPSTFFLDSPAAAATLTVLDVTVTNPTSEGSGISVQGYAANANTLTLRNVTVKGCEGPGLRLYDAATLDMANSTITRNKGAGTNDGNKGGGIFVMGGSSSPATVTITDSTISGNSAPQKGGGIYADFVTATLTRVKVNGNTTRGNDGGGAHFDTGTVSLTECQFNENYAGGDGGGTVLRDVQGTITDCQFNRNTGDDAGGLWLRAISVATTYTLLGANTIDFNTALNDSGGVELGSDGPENTVTIGGKTSISGNRVPGYGDPSGGLRLQGGTVTATLQDDVVIANNTSTDRGGGITLNNATHTVTIKHRVAITGNTSEASYGGGIVLNGNNTAGSGGTVAIEGSDVRITGNSALNGSGIASRNGIVTGADNTIVSGNIGSPNCQTSTDGTTWTTVACDQL